jgi:large subunit ribosomal protein L17
MKHRIAGKKLGRTGSHRASMQRNFICSVILHERVVTTLPIAKGMRRGVEKAITLAKVKTLTSYRRLLSLLRDKEAVKKLFAEIAPRYATRPGGYVRIVRMPGYRIGDGAGKAIFELVGNEVLEKQLQKRAATSAE